jgi:hypothetical protein
MWSAALGGRPLLLVRNVAQARSLILRARLGGDAQFALPANATPALVHLFKRARQPFAFADLDGHLALDAPGGSLAWAQPVGNLAAMPAHTGAGPLVVDYGDLAPAPTFTLSGDVVICGLSASPDQQQAGALLVFSDPALARQVQAHMLAGDLPDAGRLAAWLPQWQAIAARQQRVLRDQHAGLVAAAGLVVAPVTPTAALHDTILVQIPHEAPASMFYAYAQAENTPVQWLPLMRPLHYAALRAGCGAMTGRHLERWLAIPAAPGDDATHIAHAVLGVVKSAEYLGVRWRTDPAQAAAYAALMTEMYGDGHDAYRPNFATVAYAAQDVAALAALAQATTCSISPNGDSYGNH